VADCVGDVVVDRDEVHFWLASLRKRSPESPAPARVGELAKWLVPGTEGFSCFVVQRVVELLGGGTMQLNLPIIGKYGSMSGTSFWLPKAPRRIGRRSGGSLKSCFVTRQAPTNDDAASAGDRTTWMRKAIEVNWWSSHLSAMANSR